MQTTKGKCWEINTQAHHLIILHSYTHNIMSRLNGPVILLINLDKPARKRLYKYVRESQSNLSASTKIKNDIYPPPPQWVLP